MMKLLCVGSTLAFACTINGKPFGPSVSSTSPPPPPATSANPESASEAGPGPRGNADVQEDNRRRLAAAKAAARAREDEERAARETADAARPVESTKTLADVKAPDVTAALSTWTPVQQMNGSWMTYGYAGAFGALVLADELGDKLAHLGRLELIAECFKGAEGSSAAAVWAICGRDVEALDLRKVDAELVAEGIGSSDRKATMEYAQKLVDTTKRIGAAVVAAAKDDPGVAAILKRGSDARDEWGAFARQNAEAIERSLMLKDAVRAGKTTHKAFANCHAATQPAFAKLVRANLSRFPWETGREPLLEYVPLLATTPASYITTVSYAACAVSLHKGGESLYAAAANSPNLPLTGPRTLALSKLLDPAFKPKFAERALSLESMISKFDTKYAIKMAGVSYVAAIMTPDTNMVDKLTTNGDETTIVFKKYDADRCVAWQNTNKISQVRPDGTISYEQKCAKFTTVVNQADPLTTSSKFVGGLASGVEVTTVNDFPVVAWKGKKYKALLGIAVD